MPRITLTSAVGPLRPYNPVRDGAWDEAKAAHLLRRAGFGARPGDLRRLVSMGFPAAIDAVLRGQLPGEEIVPPDWAGEPLPPPRELARLSREQRQKRMREGRLRMAELEQWWLRCMTATGDPLREKTALFLHAHVVPSSAQKVREPRLVFLQIELLRRRALGKYGEILAGIARDPAMLVYLDNRRNRKGRPNENFARELMELFTVGIGNYTERDVKEAARAFTGWSALGDAFAFNRRLHDDGKKSFLGKEGDLDGDDVLKMLVEHPQTAARLAERLARFFVADVPDPALVTALAERLRRNGLDVGDTLGAILRSASFYDPAARYARVKCPVELVLGAVRALEADLPPRLIAGAIRTMGQPLYQPPSVKGWDGGLDWINASNLFARYNALTGLATGGPAGRRGRPANRQPAAQGARVDLARLGLNRGEPRALERRIGVLLFGERLPDGLEQEVRRLLEDADTAGVPGERAVRGALALAMASPAYQLC